MSDSFIGIKKDFSAELKNLLIESKVMAEERSLSEAISVLLSFEKKCRLNNDFSSLKEVCVFIIQMCKEKGDWAKLNSCLVVISKRRAQNKLVVGAIVTEAYAYIEQTPSKEIKIELIKTLKDVCAGKMYVEAEDARLHLMLALIHEEDGDLAAACDMIQDVHVETYGALTKLEKAEYILQQIRLNMLRRDYIRALIQSRKMNRKIIEEEGFEGVKIEFYRMMIEYHRHERDTWEICQCFYKIFDTKNVRADPIAMASALQSTVLFLLLSKYDNHQRDMLHRLKLVKEMESLPIHSAILELFSTDEIVPLPFPGMTDLLAALTLPRHVVTDSNPADDEFFTSLLPSRVIQFNLRVVAKYYSKIHFQRLAGLLGLSTDSLEQHLSEMAANGDMHLKINRPEGIVVFSKVRPVEDVLSDWASDIGSLMNLMESTCHLIRREMMVHKLS